jgi:hypothetical protein
VLEVTEGLGGAVAERDGLLDLEVERDLAVFTPRPYSIGTRARKRRSCPARRSSSASESGAVRKPSSAASISA